jgi:glycerophosphoryl diester phosphodiesterase
MRRPLLAVLTIAAALAAPPAASAAKNPWLRSTPLNIAHQGGEDEFPSNTMYAFRRALAVGADMLELDVGVTKDGQVVVMHDTTLDRTTSGHGTIASHTLAQVRRLDAAYWFSGGSPAPRRPTACAGWPPAGVARPPGSAARTSACPRCVRC